MFAYLQGTLSLWLREKTGLTVNFLVLLCIAGIALVGAFIFLCVSGYAWAASQLGPVFGGLAAAGVFLAIAACCLVVAGWSRSNARRRATLERAAQSRNASALLDPKLLRVAVEAGRHVGWQRLVPIIALGFLATQSAQEWRRARTRSEST
jgi:membrane protein implicated in regulation of membrane protease activity